MRKYPKYKSSEIEWFGEVPIDWVRNRLKFCFNSINGGVWGEEPLGDENDIICVRVADFNYGQGIIDITNFTTRNISKSEQKSRLLKKGDLLIEKSGGGELSPVGRVVIFDLDIKAVCSNFINRLNTKSQFNPNYLNYLNRFLYSKGITESCINQTTGIQNLKVGEFISNTIYIPSLSEQNSIVRFLDHKTGQIDRFIANRQKQIELLKEQKAAIINKAVTKGINPNAKMKDSGIEWIDQVPRHWKKLRLKNLTTRITNGFVGSTSNILRESGVRYIQALHVKQNTIIFNVPYFVGEEWSKGHPRSILREGDIVITQTGAMTGDVGLVPKEFEGCNCHALIIVKPDQRKVIPAYLLNLLASKFGNSLLESIRTGSMHPHLNSTIVCDINLSIPEELKEQQAILDFINAEISDIDVLISKYQKQIDLMQEYRTALISQAVTGKIDVRDWQPKSKEYKTDDWPLSAAAEK